MSLTRNIGSSLTVDVRYIGTLSRKQMSSVNLNSVNMYAKTGGKTLFDLLSAVRRGENPVELDNMFMGLGISNATAVGKTNSSGVYQTAGAQMRAATAVYTPSYATVASSLANGNFSDLAAWIGRGNIATNNNPGKTNPVYTAGNLLRYNGFPENWIYTNPQYSSVTWNGNLDHANYHSMQTQVTLRPTHGLSLSATWTWSRNLGIRNVQDPRNRAVDFGLLNTHRTHALTTYGTFDLPFGPNRTLFSNVNPSVAGTHNRRMAAELGAHHADGPAGLFPCQNVVVGQWNSE